MPASALLRQVPPALAWGLAPHLRAACLGPEAIWRSDRQHALPTNSPMRESSAVGSKIASSSGEPTCSQMAFLLPSPSSALLGAFACDTLRILPKNSDWSMLSMASSASALVSNSTYAKPRCESAESRVVGCGSCTSTISPNGMKASCMWAAVTVCGSPPTNTVAFQRAASAIPMVFLRAAL